MVTDEEILIEVEEELKCGMSGDYTALVLEAVGDEIIEDIKVSSDFPKYNNSDIRYALGRVISSKLIKIDEIKHFCYDLLDNYDKDSVENNLAQNILHIIS